MKRILGVLSVLLIASCTSLSDLEGQGKNSPEGDETQQADYDGYYLYRGQKIPVQRVNGKFFVIFHSADSSELESELSKVGATLDSVKVQADYFPGGDFTDCRTATINGGYENMVTALSLGRFWSPYYQVDGGDEIYLTGLFTVVMKPGTSLSQLKKLADENSVEMIGFDKYTPTWYDLVCIDLFKYNSLEMANLFYDSGLFEDAFPDFVARIIFDDDHELIKP
jgi:hypothetical protein